MMDARCGWRVWGFRVCREGPFTWARAARACSTVEGFCLLPSALFTNVHVRAGAGVLRV